MSFEYIKSSLVEKQQASLKRSRKRFDCVGPRTLSYAGKQYLNFASNDYLGLSENSAGENSAGENSVSDLTSNLGSTSSPLVTGYHSAHRELENYLTEHLGYQSCLLFASGFSANSSVLKTLMSQPNSEIFQDKLNHASLIDGGLAANATNTRFNHNDLNHLTRRLEKSQAHHKLVVSEGVFSMDGDTAPIEQLKTLCIEHNAWLMIDDAHGFGVRGEHGLGSCSRIKPDILVVTFGKAVASMGAAILCSRDVADYLVQFNRDYIYSTALSPSLAKATLHQLQHVYNADDRRKILSNNITYFKQLADQNNLPIMPSNTAIQPLVLGDSETCLKVGEMLTDSGIWATAIRPPTVPFNTARIRITLTASHTKCDIEQLIEALSKGSRGL
jgi:8-amino-7-oxononanoate synthase